jgi:hypothetical protein
MGLHRATGEREAQRDHQQCVMDQPVLSPHCDASPVMDQAARYHRPQAPTPAEVADARDICGGALDLVEDHELAAVGL